LRNSPAGLIENLERSPLPWWTAALTFLAFVLARNMLEGALGPSGSLGFVYFASPSALMVLDHFLFFYTSLFLSISLALSILSGQRIGLVMKVVAPAWALVLIPPFLDYALSAGEGVRIAYVLGLRSVLLDFFNPRAALENISIGQRVEILGACLLALAYVRVKSRSWARGIGAFILVYLIMAVHGVLPSALARLWETLTGAVGVPAEFAYRLVFKTGGIVPSESRKLALVFLFSSAFFGWLAFLRYNRKKAHAMLGNLRPLRSIHYVGMAAFGVAFGWVIFSRAGVAFAGGGDVLGIAAVCLAAYCAFQASVALNDLFDVEGDRIVERQRPLVTGALGRRDLLAQFGVFAGLALLLALNVKYATFLLMLLALALSFFYSAPPVRLKRFPLVSSLTLGLVSYLTCLVGFSAFAEERAIAIFPSKLAWVIVLSFGLGFAAKDLKDVEGDEATGVWTLPVVLGSAPGRATVAGLVFLGYLVVPIFLPYPMIVIPAILFGAGSALLVFVWRKRWLDRVLLAASLFFTLVVALLVLTGVTALVPTPSAIERGKARELQGRMAESWNDWAAAFSAFADAAAVFPDNVDDQLRAGATAEQDGRYEDAVPYLEKAVDLDPSSSVALEYLITAESKLGRIDDADWLIHETIRDGIRPGLFYEVMGRHLLDTGEPDRAALAYANAIRLGRPDVPARLGLADALARAGRREEAGAQYALAVKLRPSSAEARDAFGRFLVASRRYDEAVAQLEEATRLAPDDAMYWNNLGAAYRLDGRPLESLEAIDEAVRLDPQAAEPYYNRGLTLERMGRKEEARRQYLLALEIDPRNDPARAGLARTEH
jgi:4-hydroxybenzoate polyprenyltransferase/Flp pilus assembly protein TadD